jgi:hypothetical protein
LLPEPCDNAAVPAKAQARHLASMGLHPQDAANEFGIFRAGARPLASDGAA